MKKSIFLFSLLFIITNSDVFAQAANLGINGVSSVSQFLRDVSIEKDKLGKNIEGSLYLNEEWQEAIIETKDDEKLEVFARYRYYDNTVEIKKKFEGRVYALGIPYIKSIIIGYDNFVVVRYVNEKKESKIGLFELLAEGQLRLLTKYEKTVTKAINNGVVNEPMKIKSKKIFFVYDNKKETLMPLGRLGKKSVLPFFGKHSKKVEKYAKENKLSFRKIFDLAKMFKYYNWNYSKE